ncbi:MAG: SDR family NAD(P)-dependent oxidoreductase [Ilumatobacteraceae bacterium]
MADPIDLRGAVALIAGGTGGIGRHIVSGLVARGARVHTVSRTAGDTPNHAVADLRSADDVRRVVTGVQEREGRLDIVVNAVGVVAFGDATATSVDTVEELFLTNTFAHIFLCSAALPLMQKGGVIVGISGVVAEQNLPGMAAYGASKAAVRSFNEGFAREARRAGVRVIDARPPHTETGLASRAVAGAPPRFPAGLDPMAVAARIVEAIHDGTTDLPASAFGS